MTNHFKTSPQRAPNLTRFEFMRGTLYHMMYCWNIRKNRSHFSERLALCESRVSLKSQCFSN